MGDTHHVGECFDSSNVVFLGNCQSVREYVDGIKKSQKGRPHPEKQVGPLNHSIDLFCIYLVVLGKQISYILHLSSSIQSCALQFRNDPKMRIYKVYEHTKSKSGSG